MRIVQPLDFTPWAGSGWRAVEAQHRNATMALVSGNLDEQAILEQIIEDSGKPKLPPAAGGLHYLLSTPFRYRTHAPMGSRFRSQFDPPVFYGAEDIKTACTEAGYWRWRFWMDSVGLSVKTTTMEMSVFEFHGETESMIDLTVPPNLEHRDRWVDPHNYSHTQALAREARTQGAELIRSESVRQSPDGRCLTILTPEVFKRESQPFRNHLQTWDIFICPPQKVIWRRQFTNETFECEF